MRHFLSIFVLCGSLWAQNLPSAAHPTWAFVGSYTNNGGSAQNWPVFNQPLLPGGGTDSATGQCPTGSSPKVQYPVQCAVAAILQANSSNTSTISSFYTGWTTANPACNNCSSTGAQGQARSLFIDAPGQIGYGGTGHIYIGGRLADTNYVGSAGAIQPTYSGTAAPDNAVLEAYSVDFTQTPPKVQEVASTMLGTQDVNTIEQTAYGIAGMDVSGTPTTDGRVNQPSAPTQDHAFHSVGVSMTTAMGEHLLRSDGTA